MSPTGVVEENWQRARLIPTTGIRGSQEQERRATSVLLAVLGAVPAFGKAVLALVGAPAGRVSTFVEPQFEDGSGGVHIPDGVVVVTRGKTSWRCLVEVKTGKSELQADQVDRYLGIANEQGFDAVLTISNQIVPSPEQSPVKVDRRRRRSVDLRHVSWQRILTLAVLEHEHRGISDPDQAWILGELVAYLDDEASGAGGFVDMGSNWVNVREAARDGSLRAGQPEAVEIAERWCEFTEYLCLSLRQDLGVAVSQVVPRRETHEARLDALNASLADSGTLYSTIRVADTVGDMTIEADLRARLVVLSLDVSAPREGRPLTRVNWLIRQLRGAPDDLRIDARFVGARETTSATLAELRNAPERLLSTTDRKREPRAFTVARTATMGVKSGKGHGSFTRSTKQQAADFYRDVVQVLQPWTPKAPKLAARADDEGEETPPPITADERAAPDPVLPVTEPITPAPSTSWPLAEADQEPDVGSTDAD